MTYVQVLEAINEMVANGTFNYIDYLNLIEQNWFSFVQYVFSYSIVWSFIILGIWGFIKYVRTIGKAIKEEVEN